MCQTSAAHAGMPLFQLLLDCLCSSGHSLKAFGDRNLVFFILLLLAWSSSTSCGHTNPVCASHTDHPSLSHWLGLPTSALQVEYVKCVYSVHALSLTV